MVVETLLYLKMRKLNAANKSFNDITLRRNVNPEKKTIPMNTNKLMT